MENIPLIVHKVPEMEGISIGLKFFDDDTNLYVSPSVFNKIHDGKFELRYVIMAWRRSQITIQDASKRLIQDILEYGRETSQIN
jgi:hypothetical protein